MKWRVGCNGYSFATCNIVSLGFSLIVGDKNPMLSEKQVNLSFAVLSCICNPGYLIGIYIYTGYDNDARMTYMYMHILWFI